MSFAITAEFPLGFYQGKDRFGQAERYPSFTRTYSALVGGAYALNRLEADEAAVNNAAETLSSIDLDALAWLEEHAPDAISLPVAVRSSGGGARAYRRKGWGQKSQVNAPDKPAAADRAVDRSALDGPITWWWEANPPATIAQRLDDFASEVPYLGEAASPVRLSSALYEDVPSDAWLRDDHSIDSPGAVSFDLPAPGRARVLQAAHVALTAGKRPSAKADQGKVSSQSETDRSDPWPTGSITQQVLYTPPRQAAGVEHPWVFGYLLQVHPLKPSHQRYWRPEIIEHVGWAEATHRAIVKQLGPEATPLITCRSMPGVVQPPNRLSIQILDAGLPVTDSIAASMGSGANQHAAILIAVPGFTAGASPEDLQQIETALGTLQHIALRHDRVLEIDSITPVDVTKIWAQPEPGVERWWFPHPLIVAESRPPARSAQRGREWTAGDAIRVAVGNVFRQRSELQTTVRGDRRLIELSDLVHHLGIRVGSPRRAYPRQAGSYVHRIKPDAVITTVQGLIHLGPLTDGRALVSLGQSRHFGGGLLVPFDLPALPSTASAEAPTEPTRADFTREDHQ